MLPDPRRTNPLAVSGIVVCVGGMRRYVSPGQKKSRRASKMAYRRHYTPLYFVNFDPGANARRDLVYEDSFVFYQMGAHQSYGYGGAGYLGLMQPALHAANRYPDFCLPCWTFCWVSATGRR